jgi:hypothetical protein
MRPKTHGISIVGGVCLTLLFACDGGMSGDNPGPGVVEDGGTSTLVDGYAPKTCSPPCAAPKTCSKAGVCIEPGTCAHDGDCAASEVCDLATGTCVPADQCGAKEITADAVPPNLLIVLDRSCSMKKLVGAKSKWEIAVGALTKLLSQNKDKIRFGLTLFPDTTGSNCTQDKIPIPVAAGNEAKITSTLTAALAKADPNFPDGPCVTNIDTAMEQAAAEPAFKDTGRESFALLITDGKQAGCSAAGGDSGTTQIITDLLAKKVPTFVVGFGGEVDPNQLDIFAAAGGKPSSDPTAKFYKAEDQTSLDAALSKIAAQTLGCIYKLGQVPPTLDKIYAFFDNIEVPQDTTHQSGWDYDAATNTVTFYGASCQALEGGQVKDLDIVYGCKKPVPDPEPPSGDGGLPACQPGEQVCTMSEQCPKDYACVAGCCTKTVD